MRDFDEPFFDTIIYALFVLQKGGKKKSREHSIWFWGISPVFLAFGFDTNQWQRKYYSYFYFIEISHPPLDYFYNAKCIFEFLNWTKSKLFASTFYWHESMFFFFSFFLCFFKVQTLHCLISYLSWWIRSSHNRKILHAFSNWKLK